MSYTKLTDFAAKDALLSGNPSKLLRGTEIGAEFDAIESAMAVAEAVNITAPIIAASTSKTTPVDADVLPILDSAAANILKKVTWANIKATLKPYFDTLYATAGTYVTAGAATGSGLTQSAGKLLGRTTASTGAIEEITPGSTLTLAAGALDVARPYTAGTAVATTSGTSVNWTSIPSWVEVITLDLFGVSLTQNVDHFLIQIGTGGSPTTSGYLSSGVYITSGSTNVSSTAGFMLPSGAAGNATITWAGKITITRISSTEWEMSGQLGSDNGAMLLSSGRVTLAGQLDNLRLTSNGSSTLDAGKAKLSYH